MLKNITFVLLFLLSFSIKAEFIAFPEKEVESILTMNADEIIAFSNKNKIDLLKFIDPIKSESKDTATEFLSKLPLVNQQKYSMYPDLFDGSTLGVFFSLSTAQLNLESDVIIFSSEADRWTIAHEFSHALIDKKRSLDQKRDELQSLDQIRNAIEDYEEVMSLYRLFGKFPEKQYILRAIFSLEVWSHLISSFLNTYELEEVRIEKFMQKLFENHPNYKLDNHTYKRSFWYVKKNCDRSNQKMAHAFSVLEYLNSLIPNIYKKEMQVHIERVSDNLMEHQKNIKSVCII